MYLRLQIVIMLLYRRLQHISFTLFYLLSIAYSSCHNTSNNYTQRYNYNTFSKSLVLDYALREISGMAYGQGNLYAHNDENGVCYILDKENGQVLESFKMSKKGDYEAIAVSGTMPYLVNNKGTLHDSLGKKYNTAFKGKHDVEGMCFIPGTTSLLLASKASCLNNKDKNTKCIYKYELPTNTLEQEAHLTLNIDELSAFVNTQYASNSKVKKLIKRIRKFSPSGIAILPSSMDIYIISAKGSSCVVIDKNKALIEVGFFDENILPQPEGITFDDENNLFVAGEGKSRSGKIFKFAPLY